MLLTVVRHRMRVFIIIAFISFLCSCRNTKKQPLKLATSTAKTSIDTFPLNYNPTKVVKNLSDKELTITVNYAAISCECAQWMIEDAQRKHDSLTNREYIFLARVNNSLPDADTLWDGLTLPLKLRLTGRFYRELGYPPNYKTGKGDPAPARVFEYKELTVIKAD